MTKFKQIIYISYIFTWVLILLQSGTCTLREAIIISSILAKCSIPMLHSAATIIKLSEMEYTGANSIFLRTLLDKKYALPYRAIDAVVFHFLRYTLKHFLKFYSGLKIFSEHIMLLFHTEMFLSSCRTLHLTEMG